jgi:hypothetical protein
VCICAKRALGSSHSCAPDARSERHARTGDSSVSKLRAAAAVLTYNQNFVLPTATGPTGSWLTPNTVLQSRFVKVSAQFDF